jgi:hypothetical protein
MTTIACNQDEMACDSRTSFESGEFLTCDDKIERVGDSLVGCCGNVESIFKFLAWFRAQDRERPEFGENDNFTRGRAEQARHLLLRQHDIPKPRA